MDNETLFAAMIESFNAAAASFNSVQMMLAELIDRETRFEDAFPGDGRCQHVDAVEVTVLGDHGAIFLCPDCGDQFQ